jgi:hypothetical protein
MTARPRDSSLVRPYVVTEGRATPSRNTLDLFTLVRTTGYPAHTSLTPEKHELLGLCQGGPLSVAETAAHLAVPVGICKVLIADLVDAGLLTTRAPVPPAELPDRELVEEVLRGLRAIS